MSKWQHHPRSVNQPAKMMHYAINSHCRVWRPPGTGIRSLKHPKWACLINMHDFWLCQYIDAWDPHTRPKMLHSCFFSKSAGQVTLEWSGQCHILLAKKVLGVYSHQHFSPRVKTIAIVFSHHTCGSRWIRMWIIRIANYSKNSWLIRKSHGECVPLFPELNLTLNLKFTKWTNFYLVYITFLNKVWGTCIYLAS